MRACIHASEMYVAMASGTILAVPFNLGKRGIKKYIEEHIGSNHNFVGMLCFVCSKPSFSGFSTTSLERRSYPVCQPRLSYKHKHAMLHDLTSWSWSNTWLKVTPCNLIYSNLTCTTA